MKKTEDIRKNIRTWLQISAYWYKNNMLIENARIFLYKKDYIHGNKYRI